MPIASVYKECENSIIKTRLQHRVYFNLFVFSFRGVIHEKTNCADVSIYFGSVFTG